MCIETESCAKCSLGFKLDIVPCGSNYAVGVEGMCRVSIPYDSEETAKRALDGDYYFNKDIASLHCNHLGRCRIKPKAVVTKSTYVQDSMIIRAMFREDTVEEFYENTFKTCKIAILQESPLKGQFTIMVDIGSELTPQQRFEFINLLERDFCNVVPHGCFVHIQLSEQDIAEFKRQNFEPQQTSLYANDVSVQGGN